MYEERAAKLAELEYQKKNCFRQIIECNNAQLMEG